MTIDFWLDVQGSVPGRNMEDVRMWTGCSWLRIGTSGRLL